MNKYQAYIKSNDWRKKSKWVRSLTRPFWLPKNASGRCCLFPWLTAKETHHLTYFFILCFGWNSFGYELPCWHLVPLSKTAHNLVGKTFLWQQPFRFFVNTYLRISFLILWSLSRPLWGIMLWGSLGAIAYLIDPIIQEYYVKTSESEWEYLKLLLERLLGLT